jgi:type VI secretion system protein VasD
MQGNGGMARSLCGKLGLGAALGVGLLATLDGCGAPPPPPPPTVVMLKLTASQDVNADTAGQGAPVQIRVYQLGSASSFGNAEFFQLFNQDQTTLGADLVKRDDFTLAPGQSKTSTLSPTDQVKVLGVFGAYRDFQQVTWRATTEIPPHKTTTITVTAGHGGVTVVAAPAGKPGP